MVCLGVRQLPMFPFADGCFPPFSEFVKRVGGAVQLGLKSLGLEIWYKCAGVYMSQACPPTTTFGTLSAYSGDSTSSQRNVTWRGIYSLWTPHLQITPHPFTKGCKKASFSILPWVHTACRTVAIPLWFICQQRLYNLSHCLLCQNCITYVIYVTNYICYIKYLIILLFHSIHFNRKGPQCWCGGP